MQVAFIGLGNMGAPMAVNLARAGHRVAGFDPGTSPPDGVLRSDSAAYAASDAEIVFTMLPDGAVLRDVVNQILPAMTPGAILCDCSTVDLDSARAVADAARTAGFGALDAPVSGGVSATEAGTLTMMAGGPQPVFDAARPVLEAMADRIVHCGESGAGQAAKLCNNMILGITMIGTCEAFALGQRLGLDPARLYDVVSTSSGASWSVTNYCPVPGVGPQSPADTGYRPGFAAELMLKDLRLAQLAAGAVDADTPLGQMAAELYRQFVEEEGGRGRDFSAMLPRFTDRSRQPA